MRAPSDRKSLCRASNYTPGKQGLYREQTEIGRCHKMSHFRAMIMQAADLAGEAEGSGYDGFNSRLIPVVTTCRGSHCFPELLGSKLGPP